TDIPIGIGIKENDEPGPQAEWVSGFDLGKYRGRILKDGVQALIDTAMASKEPMTLIAIGPPPSLAQALAREPRLAGKLRFAGMYGRLYRGDGKPTPRAGGKVGQPLPGGRQADARAGVERQGARRGGPRGARRTLARGDRDAARHLRRREADGRALRAHPGVERPAAARARRGLRRLVPESRLVRERPRVRRPEELDSV